MRFLLLAALAGLSCLQVNSETANDLKFKLPGVSGRYYDEGIFSQKKRKIFFIISPHCRYSSKFYDFIKKIFKELNSLLYATYLVSPNYPEALIPDDLSYTDLDVDLEGMSRLAKRHNFTIPFIYDGDSKKITHHFEVNTTPAVVYLGKNNELIYKGKIGEIIMIFYRNFWSAVGPENPQILVRNGRYRVGNRWKILLQGLETSQPNIGHQCDRRI